MNIDQLAPIYSLLLFSLLVSLSYCCFLDRNANKLARLAILVYLTVTESKVPVEQC